MKKIYLKILIGVISIALLGLVGIQLYWINSAITLKNHQFNQSVSKALYNVSVKLERIEAINRMKNRQINRQTFLKNLQSLMQLQYAQPSGTSSTISLNQDTVEINNGENASQKTSDIQDKQVAYKKMQFINNIISSLNSMNPFINGPQGINKKLLDSLIKGEFSHFGIKTAYKYEVFNQFGNSIYDKLTKKELTDYKKNSYNVQLFPNDIFGRPSSFLSVLFPNKEGYLLKTMWVMLSSSALFIIIIVAAFSFTILTILRQKKLSKIKNDFINNMTHELKTPISTISLATEALADPAMGKIASARNNYVSMIREENKRLATMVENVLKSATWDKQDFTLKFKELNINEVIEEICNRLSLQIKNKNGVLIKELNAENSIIKADRQHISNVIFNLMDNAIKYTPKELVLTVGSKNTQGGVVIRVEDNGIGIGKEEQKKIFDKFYRVTDGNRHDVKGFGLGLNYVKAIIDKHHGEIQVRSQLGKGTKLSIFLPFNKK